MLSRFAAVKNLFLGGLRRITVRRDYFSPCLSALYYTANGEELRLRPKALLFSPPF